MIQRRANRVSSLCDVFHKVTVCLGVSLDFQLILNDQESCVKLMALVSHDSDICSTGSE